MLLAAFAAASVLLGIPAPQAQADIPANGRSWELITVNPPSSSRVVGLRPIRDDGERLIYGAAGPPEDSLSGAGITYGGAIRGSSGWIDVPVGLPYEGEFPGQEPLAAVAPLLASSFSEDEETIVWVASVPLILGAPPEGDLALYRELPDGTVQFIAKVGDGPTSVFSYGSFADIARDGGRVVFAADAHLLPADAARTQGRSVYTWDGGSLELVDVDDGGTLLSTCGSEVSRANGMSASADRVFFSISPECGNLEKVYLADLETGSTTEISASLCTRLDCNADGNVRFAGATPDGNFAYLVTTQQLVNADENSRRDLYRYTVGTGGLSLLSGGASAATEDVADQQVFPSDHGERVYFRTIGEIPLDGSSPDQKLFMADGGGLHLVAEASLSPPTEISLSADGNRALFTTQTKVLEGDTDSQEDAYLYDAEAETLTRVSTGPSGGNQEYPVRIEPGNPVNRHPIEYGNTRPYYAIDAAGDRAFFQTAEPLIPEDSNSAPDVYEWWNDGLSLVSPGNQPLGSDFAGVSRDGRSVIFGTNASLVGRDVDGESRDLYSARLGAGFPEPQSDSPGCDLASCPLPSAGRITRATPPSMAQLQSKRGALRVISVASKAKKGAIAVLVSVPASGVVSGLISIQEKGKKVVLAAGKIRAKHDGQAQLKLKLTPSARRSPGGGAKAAQLTVKQGSSKVSQTVKVSLR
ncbi:MAG TPA: hypothetical protein VFI03_06695 [Solirubrobacterales bacterium]|nr:hypothetical protein [Solirubrobacterales bacterium]